MFVPDGPDAEAAKLMTAFELGWFEDRFIANEALIRWSCFHVSWIY